jgi:hypothetical protein
VSRVAGIEEELTRAMDTAGNQQRPWNKFETMAVYGGAPLVYSRCEAGVGVL